VANCGLLWKGFERQPFAVRRALIERRYARTRCFEVKEW
jgi:hypothetical protein